MFHDKAGFTIVELLVILGITVFLFVIVGTLASNILPRSELHAESEVVMELLRRAQTRSQHRAEDSQWGVAFTANSATLFAGASYATRDVTFDEVHEFADDIIVSGLTEVVFQFRTGETANSGTITLNASSTGEEWIVTVYTSGLVER